MLQGQRIIAHFVQPVEMLEEKQAEENAFLPQLLSQKKKGSHDLPPFSRK
jgi:hypothetical protein